MGFDRQRIVPGFATLAILLAVPAPAQAQSSPRIMSGCFVLERLDGKELPLPSPFEILLMPHTGRPEAEPQAVTRFPAVAQPASSGQIRGTWIGRGDKSAFFEFSVFSDRLRGTIWLTEENDEPLPHEVDARPTPCPETSPPF